MNAILKSMRTATAAFALICTAGLAQADLSEADKAAIDGKSGLRVLTSDGAYVGLTNGLYFFDGDRIRMFVDQKSGSMFRRKVDSVNITTFTDKVTLDGQNLILSQSSQRVRNAAPPIFRGEDGPLNIALLSRR